MSVLATAHTRMTQLASYDERLTPIAELLDAAQIQLEEAVASLTRYLDRTDLDASKLAQVDARVSGLHAAARKFKAAPEALADVWRMLKKQTAGAVSAGDLEALRAAEGSARISYEKAAQEFRGNARMRPSEWAPKSRAQCRI